jgi:hypothetical protein
MPSFFVPDAEFGTLTTLAGTWVLSLVQDTRATRQIKITILSFFFTYLNSVGSV